MLRRATVSMNAASVRWALFAGGKKTGLPETRREVRFGKIWVREEISVYVVMALLERLRVVIEEKADSGCSGVGTSESRADMLLFWSESVVRFGNRVIRERQSGMRDVKAFMSMTRVLTVTKRCLTCPGVDGLKEERLLAATDNELSEGNSTSTASSSIRLQSMPSI